MLKIRPATEDDVEQLSSLAMKTYTDSFGNSMRKSDLEAHLKRDCSPEFFYTALHRDIIIIAELEDKIVGYTKFGDVGLPVLDHTEQDRELHRIFISTDHQGQKIGSQLMDATMEHPEMKNAANIYLDVWEHNEGAIKFYERYGYKVIGKHKIEVDSGDETDHDLIMKKENKT